MARKQRTPEQALALVKARAKAREERLRATLPPPSSTRRSRHVGLWLVGALGLMLWKCSGTDMQRNRYASLDDCLRDYTLTQCSPDGSYGYSGYHYVGPWYRSRVSARGIHGDPGAGRSGVAGGNLGVELGSRGGFGSSGRVFARSS